MKILVFETAMMRNFDYDISNISQQMQTITSRDDINAFVKQNSDGAVKLKPYPLTSESGLLTLTVEKMASKEFQNRLEFEVDYELFRKTKILEHLFKPILNLKGSLRKLKASMLNRRSNLMF